MNPPTLSLQGRLRGSSGFAEGNEEASSVFRKLTCTPIITRSRDRSGKVPLVKKIIKTRVVYFVQCLDLSNCASLPHFSKKPFFFHLSSQNPSYFLLKSDNETRWENLRASSSPFLMLTLQSACFSPVETELDGSRSAASTSLWPADLASGSSLG